MAVHILSVIITVGIFWLAVPGSDLFSWHPTCMIVAFALLQLQAIVVFSPESSLFPTTPRNEKIQLHWILQCFGMTSALFGFGAVFLNKEIHERKHFTSWHGLFGLCTCVGAVLALLGGIAAKYSQSLKTWIRPVNLKMYHATGGMIVFLLAMTTLTLAVYSNWFKNRVSGWAWRISLWMPIVLGVCIARQVTQSYLPRVLTPRESESDAKSRQIQEKIEAKLKKQKERKTRSSTNKKDSWSDRSEDSQDDTIDMEHQNKNQEETAKDK